MGPSRYHPRLIALGLLSAALHSTSALGLFLAADISRFIPSCARTCVLSFIQVSYDDDTCGTSTPGLKCLCGVRGPTGFTLGEGAVQCIVAERQIGFCSENEAPQSIINGALDMCDGIEDAVEPTHTQLVATLVLPSTGPGIITFPSPTEAPYVTTTRPAPTTRITSTRRPTSTKTLPSTRPKTTASGSPTTTATDSVTTTSSTSATTSSATAAPVPADGDGSRPNSNRNNVITGLVVGILAVVILTIAVYCWLHRRHKAQKQDKEHKIQCADISSPKPLSRLSNSLGFVFSNLRSPASPIPAAYPPPSAGWRPDTIGLALSHDPNLPFSPVHTAGSNLLPTNMPAVAPRSGSDPALTTALSPMPAAKPTVTIVPAEGNGDGSDPQAGGGLAPSSAAAEPSRPSSGRSKDSVMTEFEEYGKASPSRAEDSTASGIWRPPPTSPTLASTYYVADVAGNWVLGSPDRASTATGGATLSYLAGGEIQTARSVKFQKPTTFSPFFHNNQAHSSSSRASAASSVYSQMTAPHAVSHEELPPLPNLPAAFAAESVSRASEGAAAGAAGAGASGASPAIPSQVAMRLQGRRSSGHARDSVTTTIASSRFETSDEEPGHGSEGFITPLVRSPAIGSLTPSSIAYPPIPSSRAAPPPLPSVQPTQPVFSPPPAMASLLPDGQPSPTLGIMPVPRRTSSSRTSTHSRTAPARSHPSQAPAVATLRPAEITGPAPLAPVQEASDVEDRVSPPPRPAAEDDYSSDVDKPNYDGRGWGSPSERSSWTESTRFSVTASPGLRAETEQRLETPRMGPPRADSDSGSFFQKNAWNMQLQPETEQQWQIQSHWHLSTLPRSDSSATLQTAARDPPQTADAPEEMTLRPQQQQQPGSSFSSPSFPKRLSQRSPPFDEIISRFTSPQAATFDASAQPTSPTGLGLAESITSAPMSSVVGQTQQIQDQSLSARLTSPSATPPIATSSPHQEANRPSPQAPALGSFGGPITQSPAQAITPRQLPVSAFSFSTATTSSTQQSSSGSSSGSSSSPRPWASHTAVLTPRQPNMPAFSSPLARQSPMTAQHPWLPRPLPSPPVAATGAISPVQQPASAGASTSPRLQQTQSLEQVSSEHVSQGRRGSPLERPISMFSHPRPAPSPFEQRLPAEPAQPAQPAPASPRPEPSPQSVQGVFAQSATLMSPRSVTTAGSTRATPVPVAPSTFSSPRAAQNPFADHPDGSLYPAPLSPRSSASPTQQLTSHFAEFPSVPSPLPAKTTTFSPHPPQVSSPTQPQPASTNPFIALPPAFPPQADEDSDDEFDEVEVSALDDDSLEHSRPLTVSEESDEEEEEEHAEYDGRDEHGGAGDAEDEHGDHTHGQHDEDFGSDDEEDGEEGEDYEDEDEDEEEEEDEEGDPGQDVNSGYVASHGSEKHIPQNHSDPQPGEDELSEDSEDGAGADEEGSSDEEGDELPHHLNSVNLQPHVGEINEDEDGSSEEEEGDTGEPEVGSAQADEHQVGMTQIAEEEEDDEDEWDEEEDEEEEDDEDEWDDEDDAEQEESGEEGDGNGGDYGDDDDESDGHGESPGQFIHPPQPVVAPQSPVALADAENEEYESEGEGEDEEENTEDEWASEDDEPLVGEPAQPPYNPFSDPQIASRVMRGGAVGSTPLIGTPSPSAPTKQQPPKWVPVVDADKDEDEDEDLSALAVKSPRLPDTPKWQPVMTPEKRGDDLYLNVQ